MASGIPATPDCDMVIDSLEDMVYWGIDVASASKLQRKPRYPEVGAE